MISDKRLAALHARYWTNPGPSKAEIRADVKALLKEIEELRALVRPISAEEFKAAKTWLLLMTRHGEVSLDGVNLAPVLTTLRAWLACVGGDK